MNAPAALPVDISRPGLKRALADAYREVIAAEEQHGPLPPALHQQLGILTEEVGETSQAINDNLWVAPCHQHIRAELVQTVAVGLRMIERLDRATITGDRAA